MTTPNKNTESANTTMCSKRITALETYVSATTTIEIGGKSYTQPQAIAVYQAALDSITSANNKKTEAKSAIASRRDATKAARDFDKGLRKWASGKYPAGSTAADDFGATPKVVVKKPETLVEAAQKAKATRKARGTKGPKEKLKITGTTPAPTEQAAPANNTAKS